MPSDRTQDADATWGSILGSGGGGGGGSTELSPAAAAAAAFTPGAGGYNWMLSPAQRARGITYLGGGERLRLALDKAVRRERRARPSLFLFFCASSDSGGFGERERREALDAACLVMRAPADALLLPIPLHPPQRAQASACPSPSSAAASARAPAPMIA